MNIVTFVETPYEHTLVQNRWGFRAADSSDFAQHLEGACSRGERCAAFPNLGRDSMLVSPCDEGGPPPIQPRAHGTLYERANPHAAAPESAYGPHRGVREKRAAGAGRGLLGESGIDLRVARGPEGRPAGLVEHGGLGGPVAARPHGRAAQVLPHGALQGGWAVCVSGDAWRSSAFRGSGAAAAAFAVSYQAASLLSNRLSRRSSSRRAIASVLQRL